MVSLVASLSDYADQGSRSTNESEDVGTAQLLNLPSLRPEAAPLLPPRQRGSVRVCKVIWKSKVKSPLGLTNMFLNPKARDPPIEREQRLGSLQIVGVDKNTKPTKNQEPPPEPQEPNHSLTPKPPPNPDP